jgi:hypothetical protein
MKEKKHSLFIPLETKPARVKAAYISPNLRIYGAVNKLTAGGTSLGADKDSMAMAMM